MFKRDIYHVIIKKNSIEVRSLMTGAISEKRGDFTTQRLLIGDFMAASKCLQEAYDDIPGKIFTILPCYLFQQVDMIDGGLSKVEHRVIHELATGIAFSNKVVICASTQRPLSKDEAINSVRNAKERYSVVAI